MGTGPFMFVEHVQGLALGGQEEPRLLGQGQALPRRLPRHLHQLVGRAGGGHPGRAGHIQFRGFSPPERDQLVSALGNKITVQESPWDCLNFVSMNHEKKPFDDKRVRRALSLALDRYEGSKNALARSPS